MRRTLSSPRLRVLALLVPLAAVVALAVAPGHSAAPAHRAEPGPPGCCGGKLP